MLQGGRSDGFETEARRPVDKCCGRGTPIASSRSLLDREELNTLTAGKKKLALTKLEVHPGRQCPDPGSKYRGRCLLTLLELLGLQSRSWGPTTQIPSSLSPKRDCGPKRDTENNILRGNTVIRTDYAQSKYRNIQFFACMVGPDYCGVSK